MLTTAYNNGTNKAFERFKVSSALHMLMDALPFLGVGMAKNVANTVAPGAMKAVGNAMGHVQAAPANLLKQHILPPSMQGNAADALARHLNMTPAPPVSPHMMGIR